MKKKNLMIIVLALVVGFAAVSTTLILNGNAIIGANKDDFKIIFTSATLDGVEHNEFIDADKTNISFETKKLTTVEEESVLDYEVTNTSGNYDANVEIVCNLVDESNNVIENNDYVVLNYEPNSMILLSGETKSGKITSKLIKSVTEDMSFNIK